MLLAALKSVRAVSCRNGVLQVALTDDVPEEYHALIKDDERLAELERHLSALVEAEEPKILVKKWIPTLSDDSRRPEKISSPEVMERVSNHPFVQETLDLFGGEVIDVRG